jgi:hypothetical protein
LLEYAIGRGLIPPIREGQRHCWPVITYRGANTHKENIKSMPMKDKKPFLDEQKRLA